MNRLKNILLVLIIIFIAYFIVFHILGAKELIMKMIYPKKYEQYVNKYAKEYSIDELLIYSIIKTESNFKEEAISSSEAKGLMQLMENTAIEVANEIEENITKEKIFEPDVNIKIGTCYFSTLIQKYEDVGLALAAYNAGMGRVDEWIEKGIIKVDGSNLENIPYKETNMYVRKILNCYEVYKELY